MLRNGSPVEQVAAARALGQLGERDAVDSLIRALGAGDTDVRCEAAAVLGRFGDPRAVGPLWEALFHAETVREEDEFAVALIRQPGARGVERLISEGSLGQTFWARDEKHPEGHQRSAAVVAADALLKAGRGTLKGLHYRDRKQRDKLRQTVLTRLVVELGGGIISQERCYAASILGQIGGQQAIRALTAALNDKDADVRRFATYHLAQLGKAPTGTKRAAQP